MPPRTIAVIPARYASRRLPGKPLAEIAGRPMIRHVYERVSAAAGIHGVVVATDDERIASAVRHFGGTAVITPADLQSGTDRVAIVARSIPDADIIVNVQGDEPLIPSPMITEAVAPLAEDPAILCGTLARTITDESDLANPSVVKVVRSLAGDALYFSRSPLPYGRDLPAAEWRAQHPYYKHIGIYVFRRDFLLVVAALPPAPLERMEQLEQLRILEHGYSIRVTLTGHDSIAVDTPADLKRVRTLMERS